MGGKTDDGCDGSHLYPQEYPKDEARLAANALDLGSCRINQLHWLDEEAGVRGYLEKLGLKADETVTGGPILGYGHDGLPVRSELKRTGNPVTWIEQ